MWRLFPKSWFVSKDEETSAQAAATEWLHRNWRRWLSTALGRVLRTEISQEIAPQLLETLASEDLPELDQALRYGAWDAALGRPSRGVALLTPVSGSRSEIEAYLVTAACDANGFLREQALVSFEKFPGRLATTIALIRCDDWVPQVRDAAVRLIKRLVVTEQCGNLLEHLELLLMLRKRQRIVAHVWADVIEPELSSSRHSDARWKATQTGSSAARLFVYELVCRIDYHRQKEAYFQAVRDPNPIIARWAIAAGKDGFLELDKLALLDVALQHPHASVRADAVRRRNALNPGSSREMLERALFDPAVAPRNAAAFLLRRDFGIDAVGAWRTALDAGPSKLSCISLLAMGDFATPEDIDRLIPWLGHPKAIFRATALRALAHANAPGLPGILADALADKTSTVVRQAFHVYSSGQETMRSNILRLAYAAAANGRVRSSCISATRLLDKWESLELLLGWSAEAGSSFANSIAGELDLWKRTEGNRFTRASAEMKSQLIHALLVARKNQPEYLWDRIEAALEQS